MRRPGGAGNGDGATDGHDRRPAVAGRYGAEVGRHGKVRIGDAARPPVPKRRCGVTTASEAKMRRQGRNGQRRRPPPRPPRPMLEPSRQPAKAVQRTARPPDHPTNPGAQRAQHEAVGGRSGPRGGGPVGAQPRAKGDRGARGVSPGKIPRAIAKRTESPGAKRRRVATGANHPASHSSAFRRGPGTPAGAPTGDQSTAMHVTPKPPLARQDLDYRLSRSALFS
jgi:hypothetical protein